MAWAASFIAGARARSFVWSALAAHVSFWKAARLHVANQHDTRIWGKLFAAVIPTLGFTHQYGLGHTPTQGNKKTSAV